MKKVILRFLDWAEASIIQGEGVKKAYDNLMPLGKLCIVPCTVEDTISLDVPAWGSRTMVKVLYFSFMSKEKGIYTAFSAVDQVLGKNNKINFMFAGPTESDEVSNDLDALLRKYPDNVKYLGYIEDIEKRTECFRNADIFIFPTLREAFGLVLLHAMAEGIPVIASNEGEISKTIKDKENGYLIEKGNAEQLAQQILNLSGDQSLRKKMGEANRRKYLDHFVPQVFERNMISTIKKIYKASI